VLGVVNSAAIDACLQSACRGCIDRWVCKWAMCVFGPGSEWQQLLQPMLCNYLHPMAIIFPLVPRGVWAAETKCALPQLREQSVNMFGAPREALGHCASRYAWLPGVLIREGSVLP
jgi:hypothetical protein